jgi:TonB family protein
LQVFLQYSLVSGLLFAGTTLLTGRAHGQSGKPPVVPPRPIKIVKPDCSTGQACHGVHGLVVVTVDVLTDGSVGETTLQSGDPPLSDAAVAAAKQCLFEPGTFNGKPTSMNYDLKYKF